MSHLAAPFEKLRLVELLLECTFQAQFAQTQQSSRSHMIVGLNIFLECEYRRLDCMKERMVRPRKMPELIDVDEPWFAT
jgi:hypothetical protein